MPTSTPAPPAPAATSRQRQPSSCSFQTVGAMNTTPTYRETRRGTATAAFSIQVDGDRELHLILPGRNQDLLKRILDPLVPGTPVHVRGTFQPPRVNHHELVTFYVQQISAINPINSNGHQP